MQFETLIKDIAEGKIKHEKELVKAFNGDMADYYVVVGRLVERV